MLQVFLHSAADYLKEFAEVAVLGFFIAGILNAVVNKAAVVRHLGGSIVGANALAATWGFLMPLCCCSGIPTALTLYRSGSHRGPAGLRFFDCSAMVQVVWSHSFDRLSRMANGTGHFTVCGYRRLHCRHSHRHAGRPLARRMGGAGACKERRLSGSGVL